MNREDIIRMARQVGLPYWYETEGIVNEALLIKFADLVASAAQAKEREACADIADQWAIGYPHPSEVIADWIRKRGQA